VYVPPLEAEVIRLGIAEIIELENDDSEIADKGRL